MSEMIGIIVFAIGAIIPIAAVGLVVYFIVQAAKSKDGKDIKLKVSAKTLFPVYLYIISFLTLGIALIGASTAIRAGLSFQFGVPFAYTLYQGNNFEEAKMYDPGLQRDDYEVCYEGEPITIGENEYCVNNQQQTTDLVNGITIFISMVILFAVHQFALSRIQMKDRLEWLNKFYTFASLILYSLIGLISIPTSIYQLTNYLITNPESYAYSTPEAPAMAIAIAITSLPLWIYFLNRTSNLREED